MEAPPWENVMMSRRAARGDARRIDASENSSVPSRTGPSPSPMRISTGAPRCAESHIDWRMRWCFFARSMTKPAVTRYGESGPQGVVERLSKRSRSRRLTAASASSMRASAMRAQRSTAMRSRTSEDECAPEQAIIITMGAVWRMCASVRVVMGASGTVGTIRGGRR